MNGSAGLCVDDRAGPVAIDVIFELFLLIDIAGQIFYTFFNDAIEEVVKPDLNSVSLRFSV